MKIRVGSRGSALALRQTKMLLDELVEKNPGLEYEIVVINTRGDLDMKKALHEFGGKGIFVREIEEELLDRRIDCAIHSLKDMPTELAHGTCLVNPPKMENPADVLVFKPGTDMRKKGLRIGTGSIRRRILLSEMFDEPIPVPIRGNIETRLKKLETENLDAVVLAYAGLSRMDLLKKEYITLDSRIFLPSPNQGILAVQIRSDDKTMRSLLSSVEDFETTCVMEIERQIQELIGAGCHSPLGLYTDIRGADVDIYGIYGNPEGTRLVRHKVSGRLENRRELALSMAWELKSRLEKRPMVYIVGAGTGDYELMTIRAKNLLDGADVIIHDRLISKDLIGRWQHKDLIYAGKRAYDHTLTQDEINSLMVKLANQGKTVVRLKGGDPYVFGRGGEEALFLKENDIDFELVPGITSGVAAPMFAGIPVTHRDMATSVSFITGHKRDHVDEDYSVYAKIPGTLVFFMSLKNHKKIISDLTRGGMDSAMPAALIINGAEPSQKVVVSTLGNLERDAAPYLDSSPAMIVIGDVVNLRTKLNFFEEKPLFGARILITRTRAQASEIVDRLKFMGAEVIQRPMISIESANEEELDKKLIKISDYDAVVFTSVNTVNIFMDRLMQIGDIRTMHGVDLVAIGAKTQEALKRYGLNADFMPQSYDGDALVNLIGEKYDASKKILFPHSNLSRAQILTALKRISNVDELVVYNNIFNAEFNDFEGADYAIFSSSSTVDNFVKTYGKDCLDGIKVISIGKITSAGIEKHGINLYRQAPESTFDSIIELIEEDYKNAHEKN